MISSAWKCLLPWRISILGRTFEQERAGKKDNIMMTRAMYDVKVRSTFRWASRRSWLKKARRRRQRRQQGTNQVD